MQEEATGKSSGTVPTDCCVIVTVDNKYYTGVQLKALDLPDYPRNFSPYSKI